MLGLRANEEAVGRFAPNWGWTSLLRALPQLARQCGSGNLGRSLQRNEKVLDLIVERLPATLEMTSLPSW
jgi:ABC-type dipeptide/oligopeptide/nickel transport system permease component